LARSARILRKALGAAPRSLPEWEYLPEGWSAAATNPRIKGWNVEAVLAAYQRSWPRFMHMLESTDPLCVSHEAISEAPDIIFHNTIISFAYALGLAAMGRSSVSMLDWGGGIGHYYAIGRALFPDLNIEYHCKDVPVLASYGQKLFPAARFWTDGQECLSRSYDFVLASCSVHYSREWTGDIFQLARTGSSWFFITRVPSVLQVPSFVAVQRPYQYGYETEYLGWCLNRAEFLDCCGKSGLHLVREFITGEAPQIEGAPEQCVYRGFLFRLDHGSG
jgi:putative methyltransferase (TIGR04325 family)